MTLPINGTVPVVTGSSSTGEKKGRSDLISVVMPCFNAAPFLEQAVRSVMDQTCPEVELIVVDDGSTDGSPDIVKRLATAYPEKIKLLYQNRQGPYVARNLGLTHASGEFIAFLDADDWWREDFLEKLHTALMENRNAALAYCGWQNTGLEGGRGEPYVPPDYEKEGKTERFLQAASPWPIHAALVRRHAIDAIGGFQTYLPTCMDYDFWLRIGMAHPIVLVPEVMSFYRHHQGGQIISKQWRQAQNVWTVKKTFAHQCPDLITGLGDKELHSLIDGGLLRRGYDNYWRRDLVSARHIFRLALRTGKWGAKDLRYLLPALLPERLYLALIGLAERDKTRD
jgi:glycosyltransferase involved in cell wall biosynthesis